MNNIPLHIGHSVHIFRNVFLRVMTSCVSVLLVFDPLTASTVTRYNSPGNRFVNDSLLAEASAGLLPDVPLVSPYNYKIPFHKSC